jgi:tetratricopeptide (TPR) repeat protein
MHRRAHRPDADRRQPGRIGHRTGLGHRAPVPAARRGRDARPPRLRSTIRTRWFVRAAIAVIRPAAAAATASRRCRCSLIPCARCACRPRGRWPCWPTMPSIRGRRSPHSRRAADEFIAAERFNADRPEHRTNLGAFLADRGELTVSEAEYRAALALDHSFRAGLGESRRSDASLRTRGGHRDDPARGTEAGRLQAATLHHALGLSLVRQQRGPEALRELKRATDLDPRNERFAYVYEVALAELAPNNRGHSLFPTPEKENVPYYSLLDELRPHPARSAPTRFRTRRLPRRAAAKSSSTSPRAATRWC